MDLNIKRVDKESVQSLKGDALAIGISLRELCIRKLGISAEGGNGGVEISKAGRSGAVAGRGTDESVGRKVVSGARGIGSGGQGDDGPSELSSEPIRCAQDQVKCTDPKHSGFQRSDGYWCNQCGRMYK